MKKVPINGKHAVGEYAFALVSDEDYARVSAFRWKSTPPLSGKKQYAVRNFREGGLNKTMAMHRFISGAPFGSDVDHINHHTMDNTRENLRVCSRSQNLLNRKPVCMHGECKNCGISFSRTVPAGTESMVRYCSAECRPSHVKKKEAAAKVKWLESQSLGPSQGVPGAGTFRPPTFASE